MTQSTEGYPSVAGATVSVRRYPAWDLFNKEKRQEKREERRAVKETLDKEIQPRETFAVRQEKKARKEEREKASAKLFELVAKRLETLHAGGGSEHVAQLGSDLLYLGVLSNIRFQVHDQMNDRDKCMTRWTVYAKHDQEFLGMAPTNRDVEFGGVSISFFAEGGESIKQEMHYWDMVALLQQIQAP